MCVFSVVFLQVLERPVTHEKAPGKIFDLNSSHNHFAKEGGSAGAVQSLKERQYDAAWTY